MSEKKGQIPNYARFIMGGLAGMGATVFVQPLDLVKNRMQMSGIGGAAKEHRSSIHAIMSILRKEGFFGVYNGLSAGLFRQATYTTTRLGVYTTLLNHFKNEDGTPLEFHKKAALGMTSGAVGSVIGTPAEISLIRMTSDGSIPFKTIYELVNYMGLPIEQRRNYSNVFNALYRMTKEEGVLTLWRGCGPTVVRAMVVNAAQLATYSQAKQFLLSTKYFQDNILCHFGASMISGLATTIASMPVDIAKTRIQNMNIIDGKPEYRSGMHVFVSIIRKEGVFALWKGFTPYYFRIGPHTVLTFIFLEQLNKMANNIYGSSSAAM